MLQGVAIEELSQLFLELRQNNYSVPLTQKSPRYLKCKADTYFFHPTAISLEGNSITNLI